MKRFMVGTLLVFACIALMTVGQLSAKDYPDGRLDFVATGKPGGGWDTTVRAVVQTLEQTKLVDANMPVRNNPGASGAKHLAEMQREKGSDRMVMAGSSPLLLNYLSKSSKFSYENTTPLVNLIGDYGVFAVGKGSKFKTINEVMDALKKDPGSVSVCGNSTFGSLDHIQFLLFAKAAGVADLKKINYISFEDSAAAQVVGGHVDLLTKGYSEVLGLIDSGDLVPLALTSKESINGIPSGAEQGIDAFFVNWRGMFGPPEMPDYAVKYWVDTFTKMIGTPEWEAQLKKYNWASVYIEHGDYVNFLKDTQEGYQGILTELGIIK